MKCPNCEETLVMTERQGVEIDYCPKCRGVWLDKGELDKIIDKATAANTQEQQGSVPPPQQPYSGGGYYEGGHHGGYRGKHRKGFLGNLFDF